MEEDHVGFAGRFLQTLILDAIHDLYMDVIKNRHRALGADDNPQNQFAHRGCERDLPDGSWKDVLREICRLSDQPFLVVASKWADDLLWAEALDMRAFDVLAKPFRVAEVARSWGWRGWHWNYRHEIAPKQMRQEKGMAKIPKTIGNSVC